MKISDELASAIASVTEVAAIAAFEWVGKHDKNAADNAAVEAMRNRLNEIDFHGKIVIGEGEIDEAPMLYIGEQVGKQSGEHHLDIAVDPIDGTRMVACNEHNAIAVLAAAPTGTLLQAPDMYMEKMVVGAAAKGTVHLKNPLEKNLEFLSAALDKPISMLNIAILDKPRHQHIIKTIRNFGANVITIPDGDVLASLLTILPEHPIDMMYGIGGAPEGIISAAIARALGGDMQARLVPRNKAKEDTEQNKLLAAQESIRCQQMGIEIGDILTLDMMVNTSDVIFAATAITPTVLMSGISNDLHSHSASTLLVNGNNRSMRLINNRYFK
ncbi:class II fructose-bisphosphatase [Providencia alcalifaciens]|uniref:Fructose-1,6-bisphosphatase n=1 Tax=Providencia alcalifaciens TaxID=126385 RepID=A0AAW9VIW4_9GAMM|nr:class II fructose-bisphosphatase [Providencia alcalifaciens]MTC36779.1 class II fructose-bisphosphatase [Providencia alcalifaciens]CAG9413759.1 Fructose-1,6-bisphosphatase 1 class 2 [Providencia alcalifaciens]CAG9417827.1 Fructose-1,6-bisphosphatase 1 class 2 [Providencia alcalifaciens]CAG9418828.1 Fructose-1,6-bisphosphatase 1 class 2 [Providencia alcalifaciens]CAG9418991.1 Fructose-1,6-bisphosphatase 1 class 2 [Providencia alcalifaciens]